MSIKSANALAGRTESIRFWVPPASVKKFRREINRVSKQGNGKVATVTFTVERHAAEILVRLDFRPELESIVREVAEACGGCEE